MWSPRKNRPGSSDPIPRPGFDMHQKKARERQPKASWPRAPRVRDELLQLAIDVGAIGIYESDFELNRTRFSPELCTILGLPVGTEMSCADASRVFHEGDRPRLNASLAAAEVSSDDGRWSGVHRIVRPDGGVRWVCIQGRRHYR